MPSVGKNRRNLESRRRVEASREINEIAPILKCADPKLRAELEADPARWLREILPDVFFADFTDSQLRFIDLAWRSIVEGSWRNVEAYRGIGKTSILSGLLLLAYLTGVVRHGIYVVAEGGNGVKQAFEWFETALYDDYDARGKNARLITRLYPEAIYPIQRREGRAQRPPTYKGRPLGTVLSPERIVFPNVPGARSAGSLLRFTSIGSGSIRGVNRQIKGVGSFRVRCVMLDDVQNDATARSEVEVRNVMETIQKSLRGLSGRTKTGRRESLTILSAITQNQPNDVACKMIDELPEFGTVVIPFVTKLPKNFDAWREYRKFRDATLREYASKSVAEARARLRDYYVANRETLANGVEVDAERQFEEWQVDAIHYSIDFWAASEQAFWREFQNDALRAASETGGGLTAVVVARKLRYNRLGKPLRRGWIPNEADVLTAFIDAVEHYLNYQITAFSKDFSVARVVDFGVWPEQPSGTASKKSFEIDLQTEYRDGDKFDRLQTATVDLLLNVFGRQYFDKIGEPIDVDVATGFQQHAKPRSAASGKAFCRLALCEVDCGDGEMETPLWAAVDEFHRIDGGRFAGRAIPCYGDEARSRLLRYYDLKPGEWRRKKRVGGGFD